MLRNSLLLSLAVVASLSLAQVPSVDNAASGPTTQGVLLGPINKVDPKKEYRICGEPKRDKTGAIIRSASVLSAYRKIYPCPSTGKFTGACPGWAVDHSVPLDKGGCDAVINMTWLPEEIKSCKDHHCKDRWERTYYGSPFGIIQGLQDTRSN